MSLGNDATSGGFYGATTASQVGGSPYMPTTPEAMTQAATLASSPGTLGSTPEEVQANIAKMIAEVTAAVNGPGEMTASEAAAIHPTMAQAAVDAACAARSARGLPVNESPAQRNERCAKEAAETQQALSGLLVGGVALGAAAGAATGLGATMLAGSAIGSSDPAVDALTRAKTESAQHDQSSPEVAEAQQGIKGRVMGAFNYVGAKIGQAASAVSDAGQKLFGSGTTHDASSHLSYADLGELRPALTPGVMADRGRGASMTA